MNLLPKRPQERGELPPLDLSTISLNRGPEYREAWSKLQALRGDLDTCERDIASTEAARARTLRASDTLSERAEALLDGRPEPKAAPTAPELTALYDRRIVLREAIDLQERRVGGIRERVPAEICEEMRPRHRQLVQRLAVALQAFAEAAAAEQDFREALRDADVLFAATLRAMPFKYPDVGRFDDPHSNVNAWFREARAHDLI